MKKNNKCYKCENDANQYLTCEKCGNFCCENHYKYINDFPWSETFCGIGDSLMLCLECLKVIKRFVKSAKKEHERFQKLKNEHEKKLEEIGNDWNEVDIEKTKRFDRLLKQEEK